ncbi:MAG: transglutaminase family protein [Acutalibacteraceae bacterium]
MKQTSGLKLEVNVKKADESLSDKLWHGAAVGLLLCGWFLLFSETACSSEVKTTIAVYAFAMPLLAFFFSEFPKTKFLLYVIPMVSALSVLVISPAGIANGAIGFYNALLNMIGKASGEIMPLLEQLRPITDSNTAALCVFALSLIFLTLVLSGKKHTMILPLIGSAVIFLFFCSVGLMNKIGIVLTVAGISDLCLAKQTSAHQNPKSLICRAVAAFGCIAVLFVSVSFGGDMPFWKTAEKTVSKAVETLRYGNGNILPEGDFSKIKNFEPSNEVQLEIVMSKPESYYLRGYVGEVYNGNGWDSLDTEILYSCSDLFYWLHKTDFHGQTQLGDIANLTEKNDSENRIIIRNLNASTKYIYSPYEVLDIQDISYDSLIGDKAFKSEQFWGDDYYIFTAASNQVKQYTTIAASLYESEKNGSETVSDYLNSEAHYNTFVYENYLEIPEETKNLLETLLGEYETEYTHLDYGEAKQNILSFLTSNMTYSNEAGTVEGDFLDCFLQQTRSGYSVHFATAAAMMFRYYGIPSRYVEGYIITPDDVDGVLADSAIEIEETHAHAWVEFYQDGVGWIPFETTPGYFDVMEKADDLMSVGSPPNEIEQQSNLDEPDNKEQSYGTRELRRQRLKHFTVMVAATVTISFLLVFLIVITVIAMLNRKKLIKLKKMFTCKDQRKAVISLFDYGAGFVCGDKNSANEIYFSKKDKLFENSFVIYEKARFSKHDITDEEKETVKEFTDKTVKNFENSRSKWQRFLDIHFRYLY